jgi:dTDP-4-dehydrorhamnose reductase
MLSLFASITRREFAGCMSKQHIALLNLFVVALMHVKALDLKIPAGIYIVNSDGTFWQDANRIVAENFPEAVVKNIPPNKEAQDTGKARIDAKRSEEIFGFKFLTFEDEVKSIVSHYLHLLGEKTA